MWIFTRSWLVNNLPQTVHGTVFSVAALVAAWMCTFRCDCSSVAVLHGDLQDGHVQMSSVGLFSWLVVLIWLFAGIMMVAVDGKPPLFAFWPFCMCRWVFGICWCWMVIVWFARVDEFKADEMRWLVCVDDSLLIGTFFWAFVNLMIGCCWAEFWLLQTGTWATKLESVCLASSPDESRCTGGERG